MQSSRAVNVRSRRASVGLIIGWLTVVAALAPFAYGLPSWPVRLFTPIVAATWATAFASLWRRPVSQQVAFGIVLGLPQTLLWTILPHLLGDPGQSLAAIGALAFTAGGVFGATDTLRQGGWRNWATFEFYFEMMYIPYAALAIFSALSLMTVRVAVGASTDAPFPGLFSGFPWLTLAMAVTTIIGLLAGHLTSAFGGTWLFRAFEAAQALLGHLDDMTRPVLLFVFGYAAIIFVFAGCYGWLYTLDPTGSFAWSDNVSFRGSSQVAPTDAPFLFGDFLYFSVTTIATGGFGDITPRSHWARAIAAVEILIGLFWVLIVLAAALRIRGRRSQNPAIGTDN